MIFAIQDEFSKFKIGISSRWRAKQRIKIEKLKEGGVAQGDIGTVTVLLPLVMKIVLKVLLLVTKLLVLIL
jgi:hypothetical protein